MSSPTKVVTGKHTVFSYLNVNEPKTPMGGGTPKYSVSLIIPKSDTVTLSKIRAAIQAAYDEGQSKLKGNSKFVPALEDLKTPTTHTRTLTSSTRTPPLSREWSMQTASRFLTPRSSTPGSSEGRPSTSTRSTATATRGSHADSTICRSSLTAHRLADTAALRMTLRTWMTRTMRTSCPDGYVKGVGSLPTPYQRGE